MLGAKFIIIFLVFLIYFEYFIYEYYIYTIILSFSNSSHVFPIPS